MAITQATSKAKAMAITKATSKAKAMATTKANAKPKAKTQGNTMAKAKTKKKVKPKAKAKPKATARTLLSEVALVGVSKRHLSEASKIWEAMKALTARVDALTADAVEGVQILS